MSQGVASHKSMYHEKKSFFLKFLKKESISPLMEDFKSWHFYNSEDESKFEFHSMDETFTFLKSHPHSKDFFCWREGFEDWKLVGSVEELALAYMPTEKNLKRPPPPPTPTVAPTPIVLTPLEKPLEIHPEEPPQNLPLIQSTTATPESPAPVITETINRKHERFDLRFRVILRSHQITFRTFSKNISLGGIATEHPIPRELIHESCTIYIANPNGEENIKFNLKFATERQDTKYFYFTEISPDSQNKLKKWIDTMSKTLKKVS